MNQVYQPLHQKYRPQRLDQLVGQEAIATTLSNALVYRRIATAYLFSGPRGTGKTSSARILARSLNCLNSDSPTTEPCGKCELCISITSGRALDVIEIDAASNTGVENIRELIERSKFSPVQARWKVYVIDECHMLSAAAFNALLKTLEEPQPKLLFILATTDPQRMLTTVISRCQRFDFRRVCPITLKGHLVFIADREDISISVEAISLVAKSAQGSLRDAENLLDQLSLLQGPIEVNSVWELLGEIPEQELLELGSALISEKPLTILERCRCLFDRGREPILILQGLTSILRDLVLLIEAPDRPDLSNISLQFWSILQELASDVKLSKLLKWQSKLKGSEFELRQSAQPRLWLEVILLGLLADSNSLVKPKSIDLSIASSAIKNPLLSTSQLIDKGLVNTIKSVRNIETSQPNLERESKDSEVIQDLSLLWTKILNSVELPSTRMLLFQQAELAILDTSQIVIQVNDNWLETVKSRLSLLDKAIEIALDGKRRLLIEGREATLSSSKTLTINDSAIEFDEEKVTVLEPLYPPIQTKSVSLLSSDLLDKSKVTELVQQSNRISILERSATSLAKFFDGEIVQDF